MLDVHVIAFRKTLTYQIGSFNNGAIRIFLTSARQKAYITGNMTKYRQLADKIITLIKRAKPEYYASKVKGKRKHDSAKWHRTISQLAGFEGDNLNNNLILDGTADTVEILQNIFTKPWLNLPETIIPSVEDVESSQREDNSPYSLDWSG